MTPASLELLLILRSVLGSATPAAETGGPSEIAPSNEDAQATSGREEDCVSAYELSQELRIQGRLLAAKQKLIECVRACPPLPKKDCLTWLNEVESSMPSIVVDARDDSGRDLVDVRVIVDGSTIAVQLDGKAIAIDPGARVFRYYAGSGGPSIEDRVTIHEGEKNRRLAVVFRSPGARASADSGATIVRIDSPESSSIEPEIFILGGVGALGLASFAAFGISAVANESDLRAHCPRPCSAERVDAVRHKQAAADVSLGVGLLAVGVGAWLLLSDPPWVHPATAAKETTVGLTVSANSWSMGITAGF